MIQNSVTTWQAYNLWGDYSLYYGPNRPGGSDFANRARIVSFDRPYPQTWASGAADFVGNELPLLMHLESLGLDLTYWTDVDLHARPAAPHEPRVPLQPGPRRVLVPAHAPGCGDGQRGGVNLAFLGANACYRQIRMEPSSVGPNRLQVCYKDAAEDPMAREQPALTTVNWNQAPVNHPESTLIGAMYQSVGAKAYMVVTDGSSWFYDGCNLSDGDSFPNVILGEYDRYVPVAPGTAQPRRPGPLARPRPVQLVRHHLLHRARQRRGRAGQRLGELRVAALDDRRHPVHRHPRRLSRRHRRHPPGHGERLRPLRAGPGHLLRQLGRQLVRRLHRRRRDRGQRRRHRVRLTAAHARAGQPCAPVTRHDTTFGPGPPTIDPQRWAHPTTPLPGAPAARLGGIWRPPDSPGWCSAPARPPRAPRRGGQGQADHHDHDAPKPTCPLTGLPAPGGSVPQRPAMAVKIDNYPAGRPQSGLDKADIVFEEPVEGGITRYAAVFQCQDAALIGPVRSARNIDIGILGQLGNPLLAHVGGIDPVLANIDASPIVNVDIGDSNSLMIHPPGKVPPDADYTSTAIVYGTHPTMTTPPQPLFTYSTDPPAGGTPVSSVNIDFSGTSNVTWKWNTATNTFLRYYNGTTPDMLADNVQNAAANVVVQYVQISYGPWLENSEGGLEVQADLYPNASGTAAIFRNGMAIPATWHRSTLGSPRSSSTRSACRSRCSPARPGSSWCPTPSWRRRRRSDVRLSPRACAATTASSRQSSAAANTPGMRAGLGLVEHPGRRAPPHQVQALALGDLEAGPLELGHQLARAVLDLVVVVHQLVRTQPPHGPVGRVEAEPPAGRQHAERLACHRAPLGLGDVLNGLAAVDEVEGAVLVAPEVDHGVEGELHRAELGEHRLARRATLVDLVTLVDREVDHHEALEGVGVAQVHQRAVGQALVGPAEVEDARRAGQAGDELAAADVHGEQHVADGHAAAELLGVGQRLGHAVPGQLADGQLLGVLGAAGGVGLAVEDDVERHAHRLLGWQVAERHGGDDAVEDAIGPLLPFAGRHRPIVVRTRSAPGRSTRGRREAARRLRRL